VLLAAIACEIAVKNTLLEVASPHQRQLVESLLQNPRDFSLAAIALFDKPCLAVLGRSLKAQDTALYKRVEALFEDRNRIAHRALAGLRPEKDLRSEVGAAREAVSWVRR
jgi:hypothetical protein